MLLEEALYDPRTRLQARGGRSHEQGAHGGEHGGVERGSTAITRSRHTVEAHFSSRPADASRTLPANSRSSHERRPARPCARARATRDASLIYVHRGKRRSGAAARIASTRRRAPSRRLHRRRRMTDVARASVVRPPSRHETNWTSPPSRPGDPFRVIILYPDQALSFKTRATSSFEDRRQVRSAVWYRGTLYHPQPRAFWLDLAQRRCHATREIRTSALGNSCAAFPTTVRPNGSGSTAAACTHSILGVGKWGAAPAACGLGL